MMALIHNYPESSWVAISRRLYFLTSLSKVGISVPGFQMRKLTPKGVRLCCGLSARGADTRSGWRRPRTQEKLPLAVGTGEDGGGQARPEEGCPQA